MVPPYMGPIPEFTPEPEGEESPQPTSSSSGRKRRQPVAPTRIRSSSNIHTPMNQTSAYWQQTPANQTPASEQQPGSPVAGPARKRARTLAPMPSIEGSGGPDEGHAQYSMNDNNNVREAANQPGLFDPIDLIGDDFDMLEEDPALRREPNSPGMLLPDDDDEDSNNNAGEAPALPNYLDIHPNMPIQSIERHRSIAPGGGGAGAGAGVGNNNAPNSVAPTPPQLQQLQMLQQRQNLNRPQQQQRQQAAGFAPPPANPQALYPQPHSWRGAVARDDPFGVWYFNPHETCQIWLGHRHDFDGGVWFTSEACVWMSLMAMQQTEGIGFMLGVATAASQALNSEGGRYFEGRGVDPQDLMEQAARMVREHVPRDVLDENTFRVPDPADIAGLMTTNRRLPPGNFFDPFHRRVVQYDFSGRGAGIQGGGGNGGQQQGVGAPGPSRPQGGQGAGGGAGASMPSRQGTLAPPPVRGRQRTATPRGGRPFGPGHGAPGPSNS